MGHPDPEIILCPYTGLTKPCTHLCGKFVPFDLGGGMDPRNADCGIPGYCGDAMPGLLERERLWPPFLAHVEDDDTDEWADYEEVEDTDEHECEGGCGDDCDGSGKCHEKPHRDGAYSAPRVLSIRWLESTGPGMPIQAEDVLMSLAMQLFADGFIVGWRRTTHCMELLYEAEALTISAEGVKQHLIAHECYGETLWEITEQRSLSHNAPPVSALNPEFHATVPDPTDVPARAGAFPGDHATDKE